MNLTFIPKPMTDDSQRRQEPVIHLNRICSHDRDWSLKCPRFCIPVAFL